MMFFNIVLHQFILYGNYKENNLNRAQFPSLLKGGKIMNYGKGKGMGKKKVIKKVKGKKKMVKKYGK
mgnify:CR=1 FL=1